MNRDQIVELLAMRMVGFPFADCSKHDRFRITSTADAIMALDGWQTIDSAPRDGSEVLLWVDGDIHQGQYDGPSDGAIYSGKASHHNWFSVSCGSTLYDTSVSHWRPLPQPPGDAG